MTFPSTHSTDGAVSAVPSAALSAAPSSAETRGAQEPTLVADCGATNARFALQFPPDPTPQGVRVLQAADFPDLTAALEAYLAEAMIDEPPTRAAFAVAAPTQGDEIDFLNSPWRFTKSGLSRHFGLTDLHVVNDFTALAVGLPSLPETSCVQIGGGQRRPGLAMATVGPGTGLGVSGVMPTGTGWVPLQGEGGHQTLAPIDDDEAEILRLLRGTLGHVSAEQVLSGRGLVHLYGAMAQLSDREPVYGDPASISLAASEQKDPLCLATLDQFSAFLGTVAGNLALILGAFGGVYIGGGICPRLGTLFIESRFRERFEDKGQRRGYVEQIPTYLITDPTPAFYGLAAILRSDSVIEGVR